MRALGILFIIAGSMGALGFGFRALLLGGGSSAQAGEAVWALLGAGAGVLAVGVGVAWTRAKQDEEA